MTLKHCIVTVKQFFRIEYKRNKLHFVTKVALGNVVFNNHRLAHPLTTSLTYFINSARNLLNVSLPRVCS